MVLFGVEVFAGGDVNIVGKSPATSDSFDVIGWSTSTVTASGDINLSGERTSGLEFTTLNSGSVTTLSVGQLIGGDLSGDTSLTASVATAFAGSGSVVIEPFSTSFSTTQTMANVTIANTITGLTIGKTNNSQAVTIPTVYSIAGDIKVYGGAITVSASQTATADGDIEIYGSSITNSGPITSSSGDVLLKADSMAINARVSVTLANAITVAVRALIPAR